MYQSAVMLLDVGHVCAHGTPLEIVALRSATLTVSLARVCAILSSTNYKRYLIEPTTHVNPLSNSSLLYTSLYYLTIADASVHACYEKRYFSLTRFL
jgi:hypothetical protein